MDVIRTLFLCLLVGLLHGKLTEETLSLVTSWAPLVWIHGEDPFYPSTVNFHLNNVQVRSSDERVVQEGPLTGDTVVTGEDTESAHLNTVQDLECVNCHRPFFSGQPLSQVPSYTFVTQHNDSCNTVDVTYSFFYPYNYGKDVCIGLDSNGFCLGGWKTFGNHVGDWEHVSLRLQSGNPTEMYVGAHSFGAWYKWMESNGTFQFYKGTPLKRETKNQKRNGRVTRSFLESEVPYPQTVYLEEGHPAVFSANGSHGMWAQEGTHTYLHILTVHLDDICDRGEAWRTWQNLEIHETGDWDSFIGNDSWVNFRGRWGNIQKLGCELEPLFGECGLGGGPSGPHKYFQHDFPQPPTCTASQVDPVTQLEKAKTSPFAYFFSLLG